MVELVYTGDLKFPGRKASRVRVPPDLPKYSYQSGGCILFCEGERAFMHVRRDENGRSHMRAAASMARPGPEPEILQNREVKASPARPTKKEPEMALFCIE